MNLNRRDFLGLATGGAGAIVATSALPAFGKDDPSLFPKRGVVERLAIAYQHIHIGLPQPFSVLHISDTHLTAVYDDEPDYLVTFAKKRSKTFGGRQEEALRDSLAWARMNVDYVIHTGDFIDFQTRANLDIVKKVFGEEKALAGSMGNHEFQRRIPDEKVDESSIATLRQYGALSMELLAKTFPFDISLQSTVINGVNFVTMNQVCGFVTEKHVARFRAEVKKGLPIILCMHCPFFTEELARASRKYWQFNRKFTHDNAGPMCSWQWKDPVTRDFIAYLKGEKLLKGILTGHMHLTASDRFSPTAMQYIVGGNFMFHGEEILFT